MEDHMSKGRLLAIASVGLALGFSAAIWNPVQAQDNPKSCTIARNFGSVKTTWDNQLVLESVNGTIRLIDDRCRVKQIIQRK